MELTLIYWNINLVPFFLSLKCRSYAWGFIALCCKSAHIISIFKVSHFGAQLYWYIIYLLYKHIFVCCTSSYFCTSRIVSLWGTSSGAFAYSASTPIKLGHRLWSCCNVRAWNNKPHYVECRVYWHRKLTLSAASSAGVTSVKASKSAFSPILCPHMLNPVKKWNLGNPEGFDVPKYGSN